MKTKQQEQKERNIK